MRTRTNTLFIVAFLMCISGAFFGGFVFFGLGCWSLANQVEHTKANERKGPWG